MSKETKAAPETGQDAGSNPAPAKAPEKAVAKTSDQPAAPMRRTVAATATGPAATRAYVVTAEGRTTGSYQKAGAEIQLTETQAQFLLLGGHITDPSKPDAAKTDAAKTDAGKPDPGKAA